MTSRALQLKEEGNALFKAKHYDASLQKFTEAIYLDKSNPVFFCNRAASFFFTQRFEEALNDCHSALRIDPRYKKAWLRKGDAHDALTQHADSLEAYMGALSLSSPRDTDCNELTRRIEGVRSKLLDPHAVGLETLLLLARLHSIQVPNVHNITTPTQISELRKALFRHPKWSFPSLHHSHRPYPSRIRFLHVPADERLPVTPVELQQREDQPKTYELELRQLLGCSRYTREVIVAEDWEACATSPSQKPFGSGLGRFHAVYEVYRALPVTTQGCSTPDLNRRACSLTGRGDVFGDVLITKALYVKTDRRRLALEVSAASSHLAMDTPGNVLLGYDFVSLDELRSNEFQKRVGRSWEVICRQVLAAASS